MTTCSYCARWMATSRRQWRHRQWKAAKSPSIQPAPCPKCRGTEWLLSRAALPPPSAFARALSRILDRPPL